MFGAKGDGVTDDTAAIQRAVDETKGSNRLLYFPNGIYLVSNSVGISNGKPHSKDRFLSWQGQSRDGTIVKLKITALDSVIRTSPRFSFQPIRAPAPAT